LESLRHCFPSSVRRTLDELPDSLDETYDRILKEIKKPNRIHARRLLQCLVVAIRPLRIEELAEVLAVDFDDAEGIPRLRKDWRWEDQEQALLSSCSSLIAIVDDYRSRVVQFSHISVKEYLTSPRLATSSGDISDYHIDLEPAHAALAQASLAALLLLDDRIDEEDIQIGWPLAKYAARYWVSHAQFENVSRQVLRAMECLFDCNKPHFDVWLRLYDIDTKRLSESSPFYIFTFSKEPDATPLYYAALCGFHDLAEHLIAKNPEHVNANGGWYFRPIVAALDGHHFQTADLLHRNGADPNVQDYEKWTPLHSAAYHGDLEVVLKLIEYGADIHAQDEDGKTPLYVASEGLYLKDPIIIRLLLERGADVNAQTKDLSTPLHKASVFGAVEVARMLLEHGADVKAEDDQGRMPLRRAGEQPLVTRQQQRDMSKLLSKYGAK
jgi:ankyrin repeat protein